LIFVAISRENALTTMSKTFSSQATIRASSERIWELLTALAGYPRWTSTVVRTEGSIAQGNRITVYPKINPDRAFPVRVELLDAQRKQMIWSGGMPLGMFKGVRTFELEPVGAGEVAFRMSEVYIGWMAPLIAGSIPDLQPAFDEFAADLKRAAEAATS
jgi:hypothetical protein